MTRSLLPVTDVVNITCLPEHEQWKRLSAKRSFRPPHTLEPTRRNLASLLNAVLPMWGQCELDERKILLALEASCRSNEDKAANRLRAEALLQLGKMLGGVEERGFRGHRLSVDVSLQATNSLIVEYQGRPAIPFFDLRKSGKLSSAGRETLFAMNYHLINQTYAEFRDYDLLIFKYWEESPSNKGFFPYVFNGMPAYSYEALDQRIRRTFEIWHAVLEGRKTQDAEGEGTLFAKIANPI